MTKRQLIDEIKTINHSAHPEFLARFSNEDLDSYLQHLQSARGPRLTGDASRFAKYFQPRQPRPQRQARIEWEQAAELQTALVAAPLFH